MGLAPSYPQPQTRGSRTGKPARLLQPAFQRVPSAPPLCSRVEKAFRAAHRHKKTPAGDRSPPIGARAELQTGAPARGHQQLGPAWAGRPQWQASGLPPPESRCRPAGEWGWQGQLPSPGATQPHPETGGWPRWPHAHSPLQEAESWRGQHGLEVLLLEWGPLQLTPETSRASDKVRVIGPGQSNHLVTRAE